MKRPVLRLVLCLVILPLVAAADERILSFFCDIEVHTNGSMTVTETIRVRSEQGEIRRGIYRDFPTRYRDRHGNRVVVAFGVTSVTRDGKPDNYALEDLSNGKRVRIGREEVILPPGEYIYVIRYRTHRQLGYFEDYDELYWNVTGHGWAFPIDRARARVHLPNTIPPDRLRTAGYTGPEGSQETAYTVKAGDGTSVEFAATQPLWPGEGLTIAVGWPKGYVHEPTRKERWAWHLRDNHGVLAALAGFVVVLAYYLVAWLMVGKDPARDTIIPRFRPPEHLSPAAARYVWKREFDTRCVAASLIHLAVRNRIKLKEEDGVFTVLRADGRKGKAFPEEEKLRSNLLGRRDSRQLQKTYHKTIGKAVEGLQERLEKKHLKRHFRLNRKNWYPGVGLFLAAWVVTVLLCPQPVAAGVLSICLSFLTVGLSVLVIAIVAIWATAIKDPASGSSLFGALALTIFAVPFVGGEIVGLFYLFLTAGVLPTALAMGTLALIALFWHLLEAPTVSGRRLLDELEGFRLYLTVGERDRLSSMRSPEKTPELLETYLPYALALDVEQAWAEQFIEVLAQAATGEDAQYNPAWYESPTGQALAAAMLARTLGGALTSSVSASSTIPSSSTAPGSASGSGGGGFSGGGGGGGGGGGW